MSEYPASVAIINGVHDLWMEKVQEVENNRMNIQPATHTVQLININCGFAAIGWVPPSAINAVFDLHAALLC